MELLIIRHGVAEDSRWMAEQGKGDFERPLTTEGRSEMQRIASGIASRFERPELILSSPFIRAKETATIIAEAFKISSIDTDDELKPESAPSATAVSLSSRSNGLHRMICVGHEPHLSSFIGYLVTGTFAPIVKMGRGSACIVRFEGGLLAGRGIVIAHAPRWFWK